SAMITQTSRSATENFRTLAVRLIEPPPLWTQFIAKPFRLLTDSAFMRVHLRVSYRLRNAMRLT
ncbi:MAG: hypothetical protein MKZ98_08835, partial [Pseudomonadales bacterium]|nr:hypothetical protein [Pseudomonadales bacterium]